MGKGLPRSRGRGLVQAPIVRRDIHIEGLSVDITEVATAPGWGTAVIEGLHEGNILLLGAVANLQLTKDDANIVDAFDGDFAVGSAPTADETLSGSEVDIVPSTALQQGASGVSSGNRGVSTNTEVGTILDNTDGSLELNLQVLIDDADLSGASSVTVDGFLHLVYVVLGDD